MFSLKSFQQKLFQVNQSNFSEFALALFKFQATENPVYRSYLQYLGIKPTTDNNLKSIPFLPIGFFKTQKVVTGNWKEEAIFKSSGTTGQERSKHYVNQLDSYLKNAMRIFNYFYGNISDYHLIAVLPSYQEQGDSSLIAMVDFLVKRSGSSWSGFYLGEGDKLQEMFSALRGVDKKIILLGVTFALLDLIDKGDFCFPGLIVMETGGMKGRRKELVRADLHKTLCKGFNVESIHAEYGMTELFSQAYAAKEGRFRSAPWMRVLLRDINDPFSLDNKLRSGGVNIIDLANVYSCAFVETQDLGTVNGDGTFEILGRFDHSDIRGCNLMIE